jgi:N,N'-diacetyllegionaminate synthase
MFIVAEIGVNWDGNFDLLKNMMNKSKEIGCNAVKFQAFEPEMVKAHPESKRLLKSAITKDNIQQINDLAKDIGIEWFCTPMYPDAVDFLNPYVKRFKIREFDGRELLENNETEIFKRLVNTKKEIIVSSEVSPLKTKFYENQRIRWLYCVPKYPSKISDHNFTLLKDFDGFSNHCTQYIVPLSAAILGSKILEIHVTSDKKKNFVDNQVSYDFNELGNLINIIKLSEKIKK